jgi:hypothetical protein
VQKGTRHSYLLAPTALWCLLPWHCSTVPSAAASSSSALTLIQRTLNLQKRRRNHVTDTQRPHLCRTTLSFGSNTLPKGFLAAWSTRPQVCPPNHHVQTRVRAVHAPEQQGKCTECRQGAVCKHRINAGKPFVAVCPSVLASKGTFEAPNWIVGNT